MSSRPPHSSAQQEAERLKEGYEGGHRLLEIAGIALFFGLTPLVLIEVLPSAVSLSTSALATSVAAGILGGLIFADFSSGFVHWAADNWGSPDWPILGTGFVRPFRHHHLDPEEMTRHDFVELNGNNCLITLPTFSAVWVADAPAGWQLFATIFWLTTAWLVFATNQIHAWAHTQQPPKLVRGLQRAGIILGVEHHAVHHTAPHDRNYCITTGWMNPVLSFLRFFRLLEWGMTRLTGVRPYHTVVAERMPRPAAATE